MCLGCDGVVCSCGTSVGLVGRGIGGGMGWVGGWSVCVYVLWRSLVGGLEGWREVPVVSVACLVCM